MVFDVDHDFEGPRAPKAHLDTVKYKPVTSPGHPPYDGTSVSEKLAWNRSQQMMADGLALGGTYEAVDERIPAVPLPSSNSSLVTNGSTEIIFTRSAATAEQ